MASDTRPAIFLLRRCPIHKKRTWHLTTGIKDDPRICVECLAALLSGTQPKQEG